MAGLDRSNPLRALRAAALAAAALVRARRLLREIGADTAIGGGGYVAGPVGMAAASLRLPLFLTEADSHLGITNRMLAPMARQVFLAFPIEGRTGERYEVTGRPVPPGIGAADRATARARFGLPAEGPCLLVFGGSIGALRLNEAALEAFGLEAPFSVLHVSGRRDFELLRGRLHELGSPPHYRLVEYVEPFADALAAADLAVARAGGSVYELAAAGLPALLVPYPHATADHQERNARYIADGGAAVVVPDEELDPLRLTREVVELLASPERLRSMSAAARRLARPDAAERIAERVLELARG